MSRILAILLLAASSTGALAAPLTTGMTCAQARGVVAHEGGIVLNTSEYVYDRYVSSASYCQPKQVSTPAFVPTSDQPQCHIGDTCTDPDVDHDGTGEN